MALIVNKRRDQAICHSDCECTTVYDDKIKKKNEKESDSTYT